MEKRTPNDADDAGPLGQHHQHHWGPVSPFAWFLGCLCPPGKHERGFGTPRPGQTLYNVHVPWLWTAFCPYFQHFCGSKACPMPEMWVLICPQNAIVG